MTEPSEADATDETLVLAAARGDARAFEELLGRHESRVLRVLRLMGVPSQEREDVAQEVFIRVFRHLDGFRPGRPFRSWVYRIAVNASHDHHRGGLRKRAIEGPPADEPPDAPPQRPAGDRLAEQLDLRRRLEQALGLLTERERAVFVLRELEGLDTAEVARSLGITGITVRRHLGRARKRLQRALEDPGSPKKISMD